MTMDTDTLVAELRRRIAGNERVIQAAREEMVRRLSDPANAAIHAQIRRMYRFSVYEGRIYAYNEVIKLLTEGASSER